MPNQENAKQKINISDKYIDDLLFWHGTQIKKMQFTYRIIQSIYSIILLINNYCKLQHTQ